MAPATTGPCPKPRSLLLLLCVTALFRHGRGVSTKPEGQRLYCGPQKYETDSGYSANLDHLLSMLQEKVVSGGTFVKYITSPANASPTDPDGVGCIAMCYADHSRDECAQCLSYVAGRFSKAEDCPNARNASAFYDACLVWYFKLYSGNNISYDSMYHTRAGRDLTGSEEAASFNTKRDSLLKDLSNRAISSKKYAAANSTKYGYGGAAGSIYGLVQCDISDPREEDNCRGCLNTLILAVAADNCTAVELKTYWCYIRYATEQFDEYISENMAAPARAPAPTTALLPAPARAPAPTTALPPPAQQEPSWRTIKIGVVSCVIVFVTTGVIVLLGCLLRGRMFRVPRRKIMRLGSLVPKQFSANQLKAATNNFEHRLGSGAFGAVYKGTMGGKMVAVKKLRSQDGVGATDFASEAGILMAFKHKNLVKLLGYCNRGEDRLLCFEYLGGGSLDKLIYEKGGGLDWSGRYKIVQGICSGLHYLHHEVDPEQHIVHLDLKASNVLISRGEGGDVTNVKIADFGLSRFFKAETHSYTKQIVGVRAYMAPEYLMDGRISPKADIYSFGVLILEIVTGRCADGDDSSRKLITSVCSEWGNGDVRTLMDPDLGDCSDDCIAQARNCIEIALDCIQEDPNSRPDAEKIRQRLSQV